MGQYLVIGIATCITAEKARAEKEFKSIENFKVLFEKEFNSSGIYEMDETDEWINLRLKPDITEMEWLDFLRTFYKLRYTTDYQQDAAIEELSKAHDLKTWLDLADEKRYQCYQSDYIYCYPMENPNYYRNFHVGMDLVILSLDGKIIMECYNELFAFFTCLVREKLLDYRLSDSLFVYITE